MDCVGAHISCKACGVYRLGGTVRVYAFREPKSEARSGTTKLCSGKCSMPGMSEDEVRSFLSRNSRLGRTLPVTRDVRWVGWPNFTRSRHRRSL